jgi:hypothetical protein
VAALPGVRDAWREGATLHVLCGDASATLRELMVRDAALADLEILPASLEDSILDLTRSTHGKLAA